MLPAGLPLVVAAFLLSSHGYPSQRRLKFWLEGLKDTQKELRGQVGCHSGQVCFGRLKGAHSLASQVWTWQWQQSMETPGTAVMLHVGDAGPVDLALAAD